MILNECVFSSLFNSFGVEVCHKSAEFKSFMPNMLRFAPTIRKCPDLLPKMSGILDTRLPTFCNSGAELHQAQPNFPLNHHIPFKFPCHQKYPSTTNSPRTPHTLS